MSITAVAALLAALVLAPLAEAKNGVEPWPPREGQGDLFVHYGEEHINDDDGPTLLPAAVAASKRYRPLLVTLSGDKADNGEEEQFTLWSEAMAPYDKAGVPWYAGVGNHDRTAPPGFPGGVVPGDFGTYEEFFADRPYPMGDAPGYESKEIGPDERPESDPVGASSHYFVDAGDVRWVFIDNSCWSITVCESLQHPSAQNEGGSESQFDFLERVGSEATEQGKLVFVVMHMPTQDPRDQSYADPTSVMHTMGKGPAGTADNSMFESTAVAAGVDGVFLAHIKGQFLYTGQGDIPYFIDGGAGGELYTTGPVGVDHGYWHGFRLLRVADGEFTTDVVPTFVDNGITVDTPGQVPIGTPITLEAFGRQPVFNDPAKVEALELRDPNPVRPRSASSAFAWLPDAARWAGPPLSILVLLGAASLMAGRRRRVAVPAIAATGVLLVTGGLSLAQQSEPTTTPLESLPNPARMWTSSDSLVLEPVASETDDPRRDERTQTADGTFQPVCPGKATVTIASGFESASEKITVASEKGKIVKSIKPGTDEIEAGKDEKVATVALDQPARVLAKVRKGRKKIATVAKTCADTGTFAVEWDGRKKNGTKAAAGGYKVAVKVLSDRKPVKRTFRVEVG